ncbi:ATP-dependent DNA ligase [Agromyces bauzanensis]|uniref:DNA ligase (ATP) n=1 Tax=Agromyces bauzanensis TaxID=1308924 RepID=A0A917PV51_9MICO|nr:ATP-dependent DNA ligase [Agromyces bauzanensis]GGJ92552.1 putative DNA ligase LigC [Agromyces bauzanensis]
MAPEPTVAPMLAKAVPSVPDPDSVPGGLVYEPKWDGFRGIVAFDGEHVEIGSRGAKPLTRYFPELVEAFTRLLPEPCVLDGEIVVSAEASGGAKLDWEALTQRIHPAASRVELLARETPAMFVAFDLLELGGRSLVDEPFSVRRAALETLVEGLGHPIHITRITDDVDLARRWFTEFEGAGLDGVMAKPLAAPYSPGKRVMLKAKHRRTADVVAIGYRVHTSGSGVGSILLGLYDEDGQLRNVGGVSAFSDARRQQLVDELAPHVERDEAGAALTGETDRSRFASSKDVSFVRLRPELVMEVRYDQLEGLRFRHTVQFERWRPDREPHSCTFAQLDRPVAYDLADVLD